LVLFPKSGREPKPQGFYRSVNHHGRQRRLLYLFHHWGDPEEMRASDGPGDMERSADDGGAGLARDPTPGVAEHRTVGEIAGIGPA
jgi:hypothetical protein